jgi:hypothetical protein
MYEKLIGGDIMKNDNKWITISADSKDFTSNRNSKHQQLDLKLWIQLSGRFVYPDDFSGDESIHINEARLYKVSH